MAEQKDQPRPHGDPLERVIEDNQAQRQSDAPADATAGMRRDELTGQSDRDGGRGSTANGVPSSDEDSGAKRRKQYQEGADLVSGID
jgi:hypothetical protein